MINLILPKFNSLLSGRLQAEKLDYLVMNYQERARDELLENLRIASLEIKLGSQKAVHRTGNELEGINAL